MLDLPRQTKKNITRLRLTIIAAVFVVFTSVIPADAVMFWQNGPVFYSPTPNSGVGLRHTFSWSSGFIVDGYRLEVANIKDTSFKAPVYLAQVHNATSTSVNLRTGKYVARVAGTINGYQTTNWSSTIAFFANPRYNNMGNSTPVSTTTTTVSTTTSTTTTTTTSLPYPIVNGQSVFATPVAGLEPNNRSQDWVDRLVKYGDFYGTKWATSFGLAPDHNNYGIPVYDAADATMRVKIRQKNPTNWNGNFNIGPDETVPFNPSWRPADGKDSYMLVIDHKTGQQWGYWNISWWSYQTDFNHNLDCIASTVNLAPIIIGGHNFGGVGYDPNTMLCAATAYTIKDPTGNVVNVNTYTGNYPWTGGGGYVYSPITPDEVASGKIKRAFHMAVYNTMSGPPCTPEQRLDPMALGNVCGDSLSPTGQFEGGGDISPYPLKKLYLNQQVPEGTRFSLKMTEAEIEAYLDKMGYTGAKRSTTKTIIIGLRDYGWFIGDTTQGGASFSFASSENVKDKAKWQALGIGVTSDDNFLLDGLFTTSNIVSYAPPTSKCRDGSYSKFYCYASDIRY